MKYSLDDYLAVGLPALFASGLAGRDQVAKMRAAARLLPPSADFGFECRLSDDDPTLDLCARVAADDGTRAAYAGANSSVHLAPAWLRHEAWRRLQRLCARWATAGSALHQEIVDLWIELDYAELAADVPTPCLFVKPRSDRSAAPVVARALGGLLRHDGVDFVLPAAVRRCFDALPPGAAITRVGVMASRSDSPMRLVVQINAGDVADFLAAVRWPGSFTQLDHFLRDIAPLTSSCVLNLDVHQTLSPKLAFECACAEADAPEELLARLFDRLHALGLSARRKAEALMRWPGVTASSPAAPWPPNLTAAAHRLARRSAFVRRVSHLKMVYEEAGPPTAKAYFGMSHRWLGVARAAGHKTL